MLLEGLQQKEASLSNLALALYFTIGVSFLIGIKYLETDVLKLTHWTLGGKKTDF
jgi:hypothetical protein